MRPGYLIGLIAIFALLVAAACTREVVRTVEVPVEKVVTQEVVKEVPKEVVVEREVEFGTVDVLGVWGGTELESFREVVEPWEEATGGQMNFEGTRDLTAIVTTRVEAGNPPDIAILPNPGFMAQLARDGQLQRLDEFLNMGNVRNDYSEAWLDLGTVDGGFYAIYFKASPKGTVWHNPRQFAANNWEVPTTWDEMISLSNQMLDAGEAPWSVAVESGGASGWPASDWLQQLILSESGPDVYDGLLSGDISWTDPAVKQAFERFGEIVHTEGYIPGGPTAVLATGFIEGSHLPFRTPPQAQMYFLGSFAQGFITDQFPDLVAGEDYSFFDFPAVNPAFAGAVTGGADVVVAFNDDPGTVSLMRYLSTAGAQQIWVGRGGFTSTNSRVSLEAYPNDIARLVAQQLTTANIFRFDLDDLLGGELQQAIWTALLEYIQDPDDLDDILQDLDAVAARQQG